MSGYQIQAGKPDRALEGIHVNIGAQHAFGHTKTHPGFGPVSSPKIADLDQRPALGSAASEHCIKDHPQKQLLTHHKALTKLAPKTEMTGMCGEDGLHSKHRLDAE